MTIATADTSDNRQTTRVILVAGLSVFFLLLIRTAWLDDDAYITFRAIDNLLNGYGLRWNTANRVQAYTHPLWMIVVTPFAALTGEIYHASLFLSIGISLAAVGVMLASVAGSAPAALFTLSAVALSKSFVDYSTSGLENPLTHLLIALFFVAQASLLATTRRLLLLSVLTALLMLNRLDTFLLVLPAMTVEIFRVGVRRAWKPILLGMLPLLAWESFSLIYYGFLVPNTAFSKLSHGVPRGEILYQGFLYVLDAIGGTPVTMLLILGAVVSPFLGMGGWSAPLGIVLYIGYVVWVGGDFMSGRFFTAPFVVAVMQLARSGAPRFNVGWALAIGLVWLTGLTSARPTIMSTSAYGSDIEPAEAIARTGITDERRYYYPQSGLLNARRGVPMPNHKWLYMGESAKARGERLMETDAAGFIGYAAGPKVHLVDKYGLGDPLMSRLPAEAPWRIGHFIRRPPRGYLESLDIGRNIIKDPAIGQYYEKLKIITEGPIWSRARWRTILQMNLGRYDSLISGYGTAQLDLEEVSTVKPDGTDAESTGNVGMTFRGVEISLQQPRTASGIRVSVSRNDSYLVSLEHDGQVVWETEVDQPPSGDSSLLAHDIAIPPDLVFETVRLRPSGGDSLYALGYLEVLP
jgi:arabinofuranosyltransferase